MYASVGYLMPVLANLHWCPSLPACLNSGGYMEISILHCLVSVLHNRERERECVCVYCGLFGHYCMYLNWPLSQPWE